MTWPLPCGPPRALYEGKEADLIDVMSRDDTEENLGVLARMRAKNVAPAVLDLFSPPVHADVVFRLVLEIFSQRLQIRNEAS